MGKENISSGPAWDRRRKIEGYLLGESLGKGRFGEVCLAQRAENGESVACKIAETAEGRQLLRQEAAMQREITGEYGTGTSFFPVFRELVETRDKTFLFMEYVAGVSLKERLQREPLTKEEVIAVGIALAEGLQRLHERIEPILYRDLKPEHVVLCRKTDGTFVRLLDLGCACRQSEAWRSRAGTRGYAAPEQLEEGAAPQGIYSDIYSLGKLLQIMSGGRFGALEDLALRCVAETPGARIPAMRLVRSELCRLQEKSARLPGRLQRKEAWTYFTVETCICECRMKTKQGAKIQWTE